MSANPESQRGLAKRRPVSRHRLLIKKSRIAAAKATLLATLAALSLGFTGCSVVHNGYTALTRNGSWNEAVVVMRNRSMSAKAWHRRKHHYCREKYNDDFCRGFRDGYEAVAGGSDGCNPSFAPTEYWSWEFQSAEGQGRTSAWFAGYPHGARAAEEEGVANWNQIQMSAGMQSEYQQAGILTHEGALYPIPDPNAATTPVNVPMADGSMGTVNGFNLNDGEVLLKADPLPPGAILDGAPSVPQPIQP